MVEDLTLVAGLVFGVFAITSLLAAWIEFFLPTRAVILGGISGFLLWRANQMRPDGIQFEDVPLAFMRLIHIVIQ